jgi:hypothetical protein
MLEESFAVLFAEECNVADRLGSLLLGHVIPYGEPVHERLKLLVQGCIHQMRR